MPQAIGNQLRAFIQRGNHMSSVRLTNAIREQIAKNALAKSGVTAEIATLQKRRHEVARAARVFAFGGEQKTKAMDAGYAKLEKLIDEVKSSGADVYISSGKSSSIYLAIGGRRLGWCDYGFDDKGFQILLVTPKRDCCLFAADHVITKDFDVIFAEEAKVEKRKEEIEKTVWAALNSVQTIKRLIEVWPESQELIPENVESVRAALPALKVEDLNKMIGLPTSEAA
ncbi:Nmad5 family putative nucleotide modification protein [Erwinia pyri]|uniref:Nmad5 family putative nucleotide modification protein n=1 Tax=Erwinia pyri TaxID=3062598 RepID=A0AA50HJJ3_9GAMM|nr:Nmad5 family putative nucleotide modification protein [Erwinia sp. DE2]WLS77388.1 Nmad5 family putative nucleotide modification protein [Erwinia sp. DE2]